MPPSHGRPSPRSAATRSARASATEGATTTTPRRAASRARAQRLLRGSPRAHTATRSPRAPLSACSCAPRRAPAQDASTTCTPSTRACRAPCRSSRPVRRRSRPSRRRRHPCRRQNRPSHRPTHGIARRMLSRGLTTRAATSTARRSRSAARCPRGRAQRIRRARAASAPEGARTSARSPASRIGWKTNYAASCQPIVGDAARSARRR